MNPTGKNPVSPQHYADVAAPHLKEKVILPLESWEVGLLHGMIRLALADPGAIFLSGTSRLAIQRWRDFCLTVITSWGFSPEEVAWLDSAEVDDASLPAAGGHGIKEQAFIIEPEDKETLAAFDAGAKYPPGIVRIDKGECPRGMRNAAACMFCPNGHMLECHYPKTCQEAECGHYTHGHN